MRRILSTGALLAALIGAALPLGGCESEEVSENPFPDDGSNPFPVDAGIDAMPQPDAFGNPFDDAAPDDAPDDAADDADDASPRD